MFDKAIGEYSLGEQESTLVQNISAALVGAATLGPGVVDAQVAGVGSAGSAALGVDGMTGGEPASNYNISADLSVSASLGAAMIDASLISIDMVGAAELDAPADLIGYVINPPRVGDLLPCEKIRLTVNGDVIDLDDPYWSLDTFNVSYDSKSISFSEIASPYIGAPTYAPEHDVSLDLNFGLGFKRYFTGRLLRRNHTGRNNNESVSYVAYGIQDISNDVTVINTDAVPRVTYTVGTTITSITEEGTEVTTTFTKTARDVLADLFTIMSSPLAANSISNLVNTLSLQQFTINLPETVEFRNSGFFAAAQQVAQLQPGMRVFWDDLNQEWTFRNILEGVTYISQIDSVQIPEAIFDMSTVDRYTAVRLVPDLSEIFDDEITDTNSKGFQFTQSAIELTPKWREELQGGWDYFKATGGVTFIDTGDNRSYYKIEADEQDYQRVFRFWSIPNSAPEGWPTTAERLFHKITFTNSVFRFQPFNAKVNWRRREVVSKVPIFGRGDPFTAGQVVPPQNVTLVYYPREPFTYVTTITTNGTPTTITSVIDPADVLPELRYPPTGFEGTAHSMFGVERVLDQMVSYTEVTTENAKKILGLWKDVVVSGTIPFNGDPIPEFMNLDAKIRLHHSTKLTGIQSVDGTILGYSYKFGRGNAARSDVQMTTDVGALVGK